MGTTHAPVRRPRPPLAPRRRRRSTVGTGAGQPGMYIRTRASVVLCVFLLIFGLGWLINGSFTTETLMAVFHLSPEWAWACHFGMSAVEVAPVVLAPFLRGMPRPLLVVIYVLSLPLGVLDVFSSAVGVDPFMSWTGAAGLVRHVQNTGLAEVVAFLPEPMLFWLLRALAVALRR